MGKKILLADDSLTIQKVVELTFSDTDFEVAATSSGDDLLELLPTSGADIVICDTIMPGTDGYTVCQTIKSEPSTLHIPVILMTGTFEPFDRDRALAAGCSEIITKPFEARNLVETVERLASGEAPVEAPTSEPYSGSVAPPMADASAMPPVDQAPQPDAGGPVAEFGTVLAPPTADEPAPDGPSEPEDGLDFTSTGFAEMEAAAEQQAAFDEVRPEHGLDFEPDVPETPDAEPVEAADEPESATAPEPESEVFDVTGAEPSEEPDPFQAAGADLFGSSDDAVEDDVIDVIDASAAEDDDEPDSDEKSDTLPPEEFERIAGGVDRGPDADVIPATDVEPLREFEPIPDIEPEPEVETEAEAEFDADPDLVEVLPDPGSATPIDESPEELEHDTVGAPLSSDDIDRIARRVVELASDRLEQIAWDVIPDMAEIVVRERLRELEDEVERAGESTEQN